MASQKTDLPRDETLSAKSFLSYFSTALSQAMAQPLTSINEKGERNYEFSEANGTLIYQYLTP